MFDAWVCEFVWEDTEFPKVEDDYKQMMELKKRAEMADIAKSQACPQEFITFSLYPT